MTVLDSATVPVRLSKPSSGASFASLDDANRSIVDEVAAGSGPVVVRGCPGSGRTTVALHIAKLLHESLDGEVLLVVPDRLRADLLQTAGEQAMPGTVRPVRTPVSLAFTFTSKWFVEREDPRPAPQLLTGAVEDAELAKAIEAGLVDWPDQLAPETLQMADFRMEVRNLMARTREAGWDGAKLEAVGRQIGRGMWISTGQLMQRWAQLAASSKNPDEPPRYDSANLQELAAKLIENWTVAAEAEGVTAPLEIPAAVVVDDLQDCTGATLALLNALHHAGTRIIATADPDVAVATYRGGEPHLDGRLIEALGASVFELGPTHRGNQAMRSVVQKVTQQVTVRDSATRRKMGAVDSGTDPSGLSVHVYGSRAQESNAIARMIQRYQLGYGPGISRPVPLKNQAVVVRSSGDVNRIRFGLMRNGIQTTVRRRAITYAAEPVTAILLQMLDGTMVEALPDREMFDRVLRSPLINARMSDIRKITDLYRATVDPDVESPLLIAEFISIDEDAATADLSARISAHGLTQTAGQMVRALKLIHAGRKSRSESPQVALWELWQIADVADKWFEAALQPGVESEVFDERLDAVVSLFRSADVWEQRNPGGNAEHFAHELLEQMLPTDTLAQTGQRPEGVHVLTVAQAIGQAWDVVYIAGVQDGHWPNLTLRDRLSRAGEVTELANGNVDLQTLAAHGATTRVMRRAALVEEYRLLAAAVSRAGQALHISAVQSDDDAPSFILNNLAKWTGTQLVDGTHIPITQVAPGIDTRSLVARLRQAHAQAEDDAKRSWYATLLATLAVEGVKLADPFNWNGIGGPTPQPSERPEIVSMSPSQIERLVECPARWFLTRHGGDIPAGSAIKLGNLVHTIAERLPEGELDEMLQMLEDLWPDDDFPRDTTLGQAKFASIEEMVVKLANYLISWRGQTVEIEQPINEIIEVDGEKLRVSGRLDRLEHTDNGVIITDIKTGEVGTVGGTLDNLQLATYQFALHQRGTNIVEARLLALAKSKPENYRQHNLFANTQIPGPKKSDPPISIPEKREELGQIIAEAARIAKGNRFVPVPGRYCGYCPVRNICPIQNEGMRTLE